MAIGDIEIKDLANLDFTITANANEATIEFFDSAGPTTIGKLVIEADKLRALSRALVEISQEIRTDFGGVNTHDKATTRMVDHLTGTIKFRTA